MLSRIIFSLEVHNWSKWLDCNMGSSQEWHIFTVFLTGLRTTKYLQHKRLTDSEM